MTVRVLLREADEMAMKRHHSRWAEYGLLFIGLIALDCYIWVNLDSSFFQAYESWSFDRQMAGQPASWLRFIEGQLGIKTDAGRGRAEPGRTEAPRAEGGAAASAARPRSGLKSRPQPLAVIGRIAVPRLQLSAMVREGVGDDILRRAVGHIPSTALPGEPGNVAFAGHRDTFFRKLRDIRKSDKIVVSTLQGDFDYQVESVKIVTPKDISVLNPSPGEQELTLVTCYPFNYIGSAPKRFIVRAKQVDISPPQPRTGF